MRTAPLANRHPVFVGIEGGATRAIAIAADAQERLIRRVEGGPANLKLLSDQDLVGLLRVFGRSLPDPNSLCIGLAGLRTAADRLRVIRAAGEVWPNRPCLACADLETAMAAASKLGSGPEPARVLILSGTGSCCYGRNPQGVTVKIGGWGHVLGDKGSAFEIGLRALKAVVYYLDRDARWPHLGEKILRALQLNQPEDLISWVQNAEKRQIAALAIEVFDARKDKIAADILKGAAHTLAADGLACATRLVSPGQPLQFILAGSVLTKQTLFAQRVSRLLAEAWPGAQIKRLTREGAWGAVRLAQQLWASQRTKVTSGPATDSSSKRPIQGKDPSEFADHAGRVPEPTALSPTERRNPRSSRLHRMPLAGAVQLMLSEEAGVPSVLLAQTPQIVRAVQLIVRIFKGGGRLFYVGAGTSGRIGTLDASECPPTFRTPPEQVQAIIAGGQNALWQSIEGAEDDAIAGSDAVRFRGVTRNDAVVGIAASGRTPFVWGAISEAKRIGAKALLICFNPYIKIPAAQKPDVILAFDLGPEVLTGSTRLKAGTATKLLLNLLTTLSMVRMGKVMGNLMVDLNPSNRKLRERAVRIVRDLTEATPAQARDALEDAGWVVKEALNRLSRRRRH